MSVSLLDINVLVALAWPTHIHHHAARQWFAAHRGAGWATCPISQCGFVRVSSNPKIIDDAVTPIEALTLLHEMTADRFHQFWPDAVSLLGTEVPAELLTGHRQVNDAYLLGLAIHHGGRLVTFDRSLGALLPATRDAAAVELIPALD